MSLIISLANLLRSKIIGLNSIYKCSVHFFKNPQCQGNHKELQKQTYVEKKWNFLLFPPKSTVQNVSFQSFCVYLRIHANTQSSSCSQCSMGSYNTHCLAGRLSLTISRTSSYGVHISQRAHTHTCIHSTDISSST